MKLQFVYTNVPLYIAHIWRNFMTWQVVFCHGGNIPITWYHLIRWVNGNNFALQPVYAILQKFAHAQWQQRGPVDLDNNLSTIITTTNNRPRPLVTLLVLLVLVLPLLLVLPGFTYSLFITKRAYVFTYLHQISRKKALLLMNLVLVFYQSLWRPLGLSSSISTQCQDGMPRGKRDTLTRKGCQLPKQFKLTCLTHESIHLYLFAMCDTIMPVPHTKMYTFIFSKCITFNLDY